MAFQVNYSALDRFLHRIAFSAPSIQFTAADIEKKVFGAVYGAVEGTRPIFITSLPRAGTTLFLEVLHRFPSLAAHSYRDMPFVMAPVFWSRLSGAFRKRAGLSERAHGDAMQIGYDSPEAFEEILWRAFWPEKYSETGITLWEAADSKNEQQRCCPREMALGCCAEDSHCVQSKLWCRESLVVSHFNLLHFLLRRTTKPLARL